MDLKNIGFDSNNTYFEHNLSLPKIPTVFIHGVGLNHSMWLYQKKYFKNESIVVYDLLNHGKSKKKYKCLTFENFNYQLEQLLNFLNIKKINLVGFSIGALIAQHFTSQYYSKINKLIIIASVHKSTNKQILKIKKRFTLLQNDKSISDDSINRWFNSEFLKKNPSIYKYFDNMLKKNKTKYFLPAYRLFVESDNYILDYSNFNMPTLIMTGEKDIGSTPIMSRRLNKKIKKSKLYIIPNAKHMVTFEKSDLINKRIMKFIS